ncbi:hypothetical protein [Xanthomonas virus PB119]|nr:hypothetical protein [Xanthomonas virus PB119]
MEHQRLRYNFFFNKTKRMVHVVPEGKDGGPNSFIFGDFKLEPGDTRTYAQYKAELLEELEASMNTLQDVELTELTVRILNWNDEIEIIEATTPVVKDPIEPEIPVPVSGEIRAEAKGLTGDEEE